MALIYGKLVGKYTIFPWIRHGNVGSTLAETNGSPTLKIGNMIVFFMFSSVGYELVQWRVVAFFLRGVEKKTKQPYLPNRNRNACRV